MTKCTTCGGTYPATQPDGTRYFHVCPPVVNVVTGAIAPMANLRNENAPDAPTQAALVAAYLAANPGASIDKATATLDTAIIAAGKGTTLTVDAGQVQPSPI
jgi:hypothetical protein